MVSHLVNKNSFYTIINLLRILTVFEYFHPNPFSHFSLVPLNCFKSLLLTHLRTAPNEELRLIKFTVEFPSTIVFFHKEKLFLKSCLHWKKGVRLCFMYFESVTLFTWFWSVQWLKLQSVKSFLLHFKSQVSCWKMSKYLNFDCSVVGDFRWRFYWHLFQLHWHLCSFR